MKYEKATPEMLRLVKKVVEKLHARLDGAKIAVITRDTAGKKGGKKIMASAALLSAAIKPLLDDKYSFVITIAKDIWAASDGKRRTALVDHELCHCEFDGEQKPSMRGHDLEEFGEIIERHGFWRKDAGEKVVQEALIKQGIKVGTIK